MKKNYTLLFFLLIGFYTTAQNSSITISQNVNQNDVTAGTIACWFNNPEDDNYGDYTNNIYARSFDLSGDHDINESFVISTIEIGVRRGDDVEAVVNVYYADNRDLTDSDNELVLVESKDVVFFTFANETVLIIPGWNAQIPAGKALVVELDVPENSHASDTGATSTEDFKLFTLGRNSDGDIRNGWIKLPECGVNDFNDINNFSSNQHFIINVTGQETMSIQNEKFAQIELFPNPVRNQLKINTPVDVLINSANLVDMKGKRHRANFIDSVLDMSEYSSGNYILELNTNFGKTTRKIIKQ